MHSTAVAVDLAKNVFELAVADSEGKIGERLRLNRARFSSFFVHRAPCRALMEACGSAHYWARRIGAHGHTVQLLPAQYVRQYVRRNKTARAERRDTSSRKPSRREQNLEVPISNRQESVPRGE